MMTFVCQHSNNGSRFYCTLLCFPLRCDWIALSSNSVCFASHSCIQCCVALMGPAQRGCRLEAGAAPHMLGNVPRGRSPRPQLRLGFKASCSTHAYPFKKESLHVDVRFCWRHQRHQLGTQLQLGVDAVASHSPMSQPRRRCHTPSFVMEGVSTVN